jgi:hypothetical protein
VKTVFLLAARLREIADGLEGLAGDYERKEAIVEAARGLVVDNLPLQMRVDRIASAVDALERAEKGE